LRASGALMRTTYSAGEETLLRAYLPATLVEQWALRPDHSPLWGVWLKGSLMFCDVSGFTAMSEKLALVGKEGAELMASVLNGFFERMLAIADVWGGAQMKFGGDAMLLLFSGDGHADRAAAAGMEMQAAMRDFRRLLVASESYSLRMRVAIHSGRFYGASVGQPDGTLHYLLVGPDVNRTAGIEGAGEPGQVVVSPEAAMQLNPRSQLIPRDGVWRVRRLEQPARPVEEHHVPISSQSLKRYLLAPLATPLLEGRLPSFSGEHRRVTAVFINLLGLSGLLETEGEAQALAQADGYVKMVIGAVEQHGGFLAASDLAHEGDKLICLFGAPLSVEREERAALRAVLELDREFRSSGLDLSHKIGVSSGFVFAGEIGSSRRREYTVIGDSVNLAARLMAAAQPGQILVSKATIERAGSGFDIQRLRPLRVKGKAAPVAVYRLRDVASEHLTEQQDYGISRLVGRNRELAALTGLARQILKRGSGRWAYLWGEPGIGKSRLTAEVAAQLEAAGWRHTKASCQVHTWHTPFAPWREALRTLLNVRPDETAAEFGQRLYSAVEEAQPDLAPYATLLGELLSLPVPDVPAISSLDPKSRRRQLTSLVVALVESVAKLQPILLVFEDAHWADTPSVELLAEVLGLSARICTVVTSRAPAAPPELSTARTPISIHLAELSKEAARTLVASTSGLSDQVLETIVARAQGNPLFLQEIARMGLTSEDTIPETVNDVILTRLDRLAPEEKKVLRLASVIGPSFDSRLLYDLAAGNPQPMRVDSALLELGRLGFTRRQAEGRSEYAFSHILTREVAYETLPYAQRRQLHKRVGQRIEQEQEAQLDSVCELLLHHYEQAGDPAKVVRYAAMSGNRAAAMFATNEGMGYYERSLTALAALRKGFEGDRSVLLERLADCLDISGRHDEAAEKFAAALAEWRVRRRSARLVPGQGSRRLRDAALSGKVGASLERSSDYGGSLRWLDQALSLLPGRSGFVRAQICATKSLTLFRKGMYHEAVRWGSVSLAFARGRGEGRQLAYAHHILANSYMEMGKLKKALGHDRIAVRLYHEAGDLAGQARANSNLGLSYQMLGVLDAALYHYDVGLKADERIGNDSHAAIVHNNIGEVLMLMGRLEEAVSHLEEVLRAYRKGSAVVGLAGLAHVNLSRCWSDMGRQAEALSALRRGLRLLRKAGVHGILTEALFQQVELRLATGKIREARRQARRLLRDATGLDAKVLSARGERLLGRAEAALGASELARGHLRTSIAIARQAGAEHEEALSLLALARLNLATPRTSRSAGRPFRRAAKILARMGASLDFSGLQALVDGQRQTLVAS
jgi:class 3 adenylate cyclase/tetratricopeptide (TPR) repeat protein